MDIDAVNAVENKNWMYQTYREAGEYIAKEASVEKLAARNWLRQPTL